MRAWNAVPSYAFRFVFSFILVFVLISGCQQKPGIVFTTEYQAVFLDNGQAFFGKLENAGSAYPVLKDVFYIQRQANPDTKEVKSILVKRSLDWHGPDRMYLNASHIALIESVSPNSQVAKLIKEALAKKP